MSYRINAVEIRFEHVAFEVLVNGGLLMRIGDAENGNFTQKSNSLLVEGKNEYVLSVRPMDGQQAIDPRAQCQMWVYEGPYGQHPGDAGKLDEFEWTQAAHPVTTTDFRAIHTKQIQSQAKTTRWGWEDATPYTPADRPALEALVAGVHAALMAGDYDAFAALNVVRDTELATALDVEVPTLLDTDRTLLEASMNQDDWSVEPLVTATLEMHQRSGGRLVEITGPMRSAPINASAAGETLGFPLTASNLQQGGWAIVR